MYNYSILRIISHYYAALRRKNLPVHYFGNVNKMASRNLICVYFDGVKKPPSDLDGIDNSNIGGYNTGVRCYRLDG